MRDILLYSENSKEGLEPSSHLVVIPEGLEPPPPV